MSWEPVEVIHPYLTDASAHALEHLRVNSGAILDDGWCVVHLADAKPHGWSQKQFAGHLANLERFGLYRPAAPGYGAVRLND